MRSGIPTTASTLHRALHRHGADDPLPADVIVVDEADLVDLALMTRLVEAADPTARLVLLGDRDQLASAEAGALFTDLGGPSHSPPRSGQWAELVRPLVRIEGDPGVRPGLTDCVIHLPQASDRGLHRLARALGQGEADPVMALLRKPPDQSILWLPQAEELDPTSLLEEVFVRGFAPLTSATEPTEATEALRSFRVLGTLPHQARDLSARIQSLLDSQTHPIVITRSAPAVRLHAGDLGVVLAPGGRAWFVGEDGAPRSLHLARLPTHQAAWATPVHQLQGWRPSQVVVVLPERPTPELCRELLYTAVSRTREQVVVAGSEGVIRAAVAGRVRRASALGERSGGG